ncbi:MAG: hypothetical protein FWE44_04630 [Defluviitaleaceae bacterium]|nr:hypothetical protein [Defluviitaleaceae bacterium]
MNYKKAYDTLVGAMLEAIDEIEKSRFATWETDNVVHVLKDGLAKAEEMCKIKSVEPVRGSGNWSPPISL